MLLTIITGVIIIVLGIAHIIYGESRLIPRIKNSSSNKLIISSSRIMSFQGGILLLCTGALQLLSGLNVIELTGVSAYIPLAIILINFGTYLLIAITAHREVFQETIPQVIIFTFLVVLLFIDL